jgi:hypothetical protein
MSEGDSQQPNSLTPQPKATLSEFIDDHSKLVTSLAAFVALTAFSLQLEIADVKPFLPALAFVGAVALALELWAQIPPPPHHWRLALFAFVVPLLPAMMAFYWFEKFHDAWLPLLPFFVGFIVQVGFSSLITHLFTNMVTFVATRWFHRDIQPRTMLRVEQFGFLFSMILFAVGMFWLSLILLHHPIKTPFKTHVPASFGDW